MKKLFLNILQNSQENNKSPVLPSSTLLKRFFDTVVFPWVLQSFLEQILAEPMLVREDTHMTSMKIVSNFRDPPPLCPYTSEIFLTPWPWTSNFKRIHPHHHYHHHTLSNKLCNNNCTMCMWTNKIKTKTKPSHVTFKLTTRSIVRFSPQQHNGIIKGWLHCQTSDSKEDFLSIIY